MKKILFPIDFSDNSLNAFRYALYLADSLKAEIITLHVYDGAEGFYQEYYDFLIENYTINEWNQFENYKSEVPKLRAIADENGLDHVKLSHILVRGVPISMILDTAESEGVEYIVMGTKGATGLKETFLGSLTEKVINESKVMVLAVPENCYFEPIKNILFLSHFFKSEVDILKKLYVLAEYFHAKIDVLEVKEQHEKKENETIREWKAQFPKSGMHFFMLTSNDYEGTVLDFIRLNKEHLVVMPRKHKNCLERLFMYSLSRQLAFHSTIPLLTIPDHAS